jgi:hypothetical protein
VTDLEARRSGWLVSEWMTTKHDHRELKHGLDLDYFEGLPKTAGTTTSPWSPPPTRSSPNSAWPQSRYSGLARYQVLDVVQELLNCCTGIGKPQKVVQVAS